MSHAALRAASSVVGKKRRQKRTVEKVALSSAIATDYVTQDELHMS